MRKAKKAQCYLNIVCLGACLGFVMISGTQFSRDPDALTMPPVHHPVPSGGRLLLLSVYVPAGWLELFYQTIFLEYI